MVDRDNLQEEINHLSHLLELARARAESAIVDDEEALSAAQQEIERLRDSVVKGSVVLSLEELVAALGKR